MPALPQRPDSRPFAGIGIPRHRHRRAMDGRHLLWSPRIGWRPLPPPAPPATWTPARRLISGAAIGLVLGLVLGTAAAALVLLALGL
jgi:hypothetical protein